MVLNARWLGVAASLAWMLAAALLASRNETWFAIWNLYCYLTADTNCGGTVYIVVHWPVIVTLMLAPVILGWLVGWLVAWVIATVRRRRAD
jgi:hypothetical protein